MPINLKDVNSYASNSKGILTEFFFLAILQLVKDAGIFAKVIITYMADLGRTKSTDISL